MTDGSHHDVDGQGALVEACVAGDAEARRRLVLRYLRPVRQAVGFLPQVRDGRVSSADAEDAVQMVFMTIFARDARVLRTWRGESGLRTYLCRVAQRVARKHIRTVTTRGGRFRLELDAGDEVWDEPVDVDRADPEQPLLDDTERDRLRAAVLDRLSEKGRDFYRLLFVEEADPADVAERLGTNVNNVYQWKNRIVRTARLVLQEESNVER